MLVVQKSRQAQATLILLLSIILVLLTVLQASAAVARELPGKVLLENFPNIKQLPNYCGPASLSSVLQFWGQDIDQKKVALSVYDRAIRATNGADMLLYARELGYVSYSWNSSLNDLKVKLAEGIPVILLQDISLTDKSGHFRVATGYDDEKQVVYVMDPYLVESKQIPYHVFTKLWGKHGNWALMVVPEPQDRYQKELGEQNPVVYMDLAFVYYRKGKLDMAEAAGNKALALEPQNPGIKSLMKRVRRDIEFAAGSKNGSKK